MALLGGVGLKGAIYGTGSKYGVDTYLCGAIYRTDSISYQYPTRYLTNIIIIERAPQNKVWLVRDLGGCKSGFVAVRG